jgi:NitT/TauT family transport system substrate-binding protein
MNKNVLRLFSTLLLVTLILSACGTAAPAPERPPLKIAFTIWPGNYPIAIAQQQGFFAKHGVKVEINNYDWSYPETLTDYATGKSDAVGVSMNDLLPLLEKRDSKVVMVQDSSEGADQLITTDEIQSVADLKGKSIAVDLGTYGEFWVRQVLLANGLKATDVQFKGGPVADVPANFPKLFDAAHVYEPYSSEALQKGGHILLTSADTTPLLIPSVIAFSTEFIQERPEDVRAFTAAVFEAVDWMYAHEAEVPAVVAQALNLKPEDIFLGGDRVLTLADNKTLMAPGSDFNSLYYTAGEYIKFQASINMLTSAPKVDELIDPSFLP